MLHWNAVARINSIGFILCELLGGRTNTNGNILDKNWYSEQSQILSVTAILESVITPKKSDLFDLDNYMDWSNLVATLHNTIPVACEKTVKSDLYDLSTYKSSGLKYDCLNNLFGIATLNYENNGDERTLYLLATSYIAWMK